jgi:hypothetical protein
MKATDFIQRNGCTISGRILFKHLFIHQFFIGLQLILIHHHGRLSYIFNFLQKPYEDWFWFSLNIINDRFQNEIALILYELIVYIFNSLVLNDNNAFVWKVHYLLKSIFYYGVLSYLLVCDLIKIISKWSRNTYHY